MAETNSKNATKPGTKHGTKTPAVAPTEIAQLRADIAQVRAEVGALHTQNLEILELVRACHEAIDEVRPLVPKLQALTNGGGFLSQLGKIGLAGRA